MHPDYIKNIYAYTKDNPVKAFLYNQIMQNNRASNPLIRRISAQNIKPGGVDTAQITIHRELIGERRWPDLRHLKDCPIKPDGIFITMMYDIWKEKFTIIPKVLCYHNYATSIESGKLTIT